MLPLHERGYRRRATASPGTLFSDRGRRASETSEAARRAAAAEALRRHEEEDDFYEAFDPLYF